MSWITADSNGSLKLVSFHLAPDADPKHPDLRFSLVAEPVILQAPDTPSRPVQRLSARNCAQIHLSAAAYADGSTSLYDVKSLKDVSPVSPIAEWKEPSSRFNAATDAWVGLDICPSGVIQCTQKGHIRLTSVLSADPSNDAGDNCKTDTHTCNVPMGIRHFKATHSGAQFAYAGKEVNLSLWNTELAFASGKQSAKEHIVKASKKRGRESLFPGEIWRAKNIGHDSLDLRQPINISSLAFLDAQSDTTAKSYQRIAVGNTLGFVHQYDTRKGTKPASSWKDERMGGGVSLIEKGYREHELYIADSTTQLWAIDLRKPSGPLYAYKGLSGKVTAMSTSSNADYILASSLDRNIRLLSAATGSEMTGHGKVVGKLYVTAAPNAIVSLSVSGDESSDATLNEESTERTQDDNEDWDDLQEVSDAEELARGSRKRHKRA